MNSDDEFQRRSIQITLDEAKVAEKMDGFARFLEKLSGTKMEEMEKTLKEKRKLKKEKELQRQKQKARKEERRQRSEKLNQLGLESKKRESARKADQETAPELERTAVKARERKDQEVEGDREAARQVAQNMERLTAIRNDKIEQEEKRLRYKKEERYSRQQDKDKQIQLGNQKEEEKKETDECNNGWGRKNDNKWQREMKQGEEKRKQRRQELSYFGSKSDRSVITNLRGNKWHRYEGKWVSSSCRHF